MVKYYNKEEILNLFMKSSKQLSILFSALDFMQQYNGRTKTDCIALGMGFEIGSYENGKHYYYKK